MFVIVEDSKIVLSACALVFNPVELVRLGDFFKSIALLLRSLAVPS